jgi:hypothetical protein
MTDQWKINKENSKSGKKMLVHKKKSSVYGDVSASSSKGVGLSSKGFVRGLHPSAARYVVKKNHKPPPYYIVHNKDNEKDTLSFSVETSEGESNSSSAEQ